MVVSALRGRRIAIVLIGERSHISRVVIVMILDQLKVRIVVVICQIGGKRAGEGVGRMGLTVCVQGPIHHGDRRLNHEHGDERHGQCRHPSRKPFVPMLKQKSLDGVVSGDIVVASSA